MDFPLPLQMVPKTLSLRLFGLVKWDGEFSNFGLGKFQLKEMALPTWKNETSIPEGFQQKNFRETIVWWTAGGRKV